MYRVKTVGEILDMAMRMGISKSDLVTADVIEERDVHNSNRNLTMMSRALKLIEFLHIPPQDLFVDMSVDSGDPLIEENNRLFREADENVRKQTSDYISRWLKEIVTLEYVKVDDAYRDYKSWCINHGWAPASRVEFEWRIQEIQKSLTVMMVPDKVDVCCYRFIPKRDVKKMGKKIVREYENKLNYREGRARK